MWLALHEYANKHQVSVSTLRRRIKSNKIQFKLDDGKYFLLEDGNAETELSTQAPQFTKASNVW